jgi:ubiquinone biosynthesis protein UbiJ
LIGDHLLLATGFTEGLRRLLGSHLSAYPEAGEKLSGLAGQVVALRLEPYGKTVYVCPSDQNIQVLTEISGQPDATITGTISAFVQAGLAAGESASLKAAGLKLSGNAETARDFQALIGAMKIDWERFLSPYLGRNLAASVIGLARAGAAWTRDSWQALQSDVSEYLREEARLLPDGSEIDAFHAEVDRLRVDAERLAARTARLQAALRSPAGSDTP